VQVCELAQTHFNYQTIPIIKPGTQSVIERRMLNFKPMFTQSPCFSMARRVRRTCLTAGLLLVSSTSTIVLPSLIAHPTGQVMAQENDQAILDNDEIFTRYVRAAFAIEKQRRSMMGQVKELMGGSVPSNVCGNLDSLPGEVQAPVGAICTSYTRYVSATVYQKQKLTKDEFNAFQRQMNQPAMRQRINQKIQVLELK
jgi:Domain of unknown function (DUF4168)